MFSNGGRVIALKNLPIMLCCTALKILVCSTDASIMLKHLQTPQLSALHSPLGLVKQDGRFFERHCGGRFTLTFCFRINSNCAGARSLLSKDVDQLSTKLQINNIISSDNLPNRNMLNALHNYYAYLKAGIIHAPLLLKQIIGQAVIYNGTTSNFEVES